MRNEDGSVEWRGSGKKTIGRLAIEQAFSDLRLTADLSSLARLAQIRNEMEHMYSSAGPSLVREAMAGAKGIIHTVVVNELRQEPRALLGTDAWDSLLQEAAVFEQEEESCRESFSGIVWSNERLARAMDEPQCPKCTAALVRNTNAAATCPDEMDLVCSACGKSVEREDVLGDALERSLAWERASGEYYAVKEGGDTVIEDCPECDRGTFVVKERTCVSCGFSLEGRGCGMCGAELTVHDYLCSGGDLCSYHNYLMAKDD